MTAESSLEVIDGAQKTRERRLEQAARQVRINAGSNKQLHEIAAGLQNAADLERQARQAQTAPFESSSRTSDRNTPDTKPIDWDDDGIPF